MREQWYALHPERPHVLCTPSLAVLCHGQWAIMLALGWTPRRLDACTNTPPCVSAGPSCCTGTVAVGKPDARRGSEDPILPGIVGPGSRRSSVGVGCAIRQSGARARAVHRPTARPASRRLPCYPCETRWVGSSVRWDACSRRTIQAESTHCQLGTAHDRPLSP